MALDEHGCTPPGTIGRSVHQGDPLTVEQIRELPDGAEVVITWDGGNGPWPYRILVDFAGERRVESVYATALLKWDYQFLPILRVTLGWGDGDAEWKAGCYVSPRERAELARLRGHAESLYGDAPLQYQPIVLPSERRKWTRLWGRGRTGTD